MTLFASEGALSPVSAIIALVTCLDRPVIDADDEPLRSALLARGIGVVACAWDDPTVDWATLDLCVIRSTWNYHHRRDAFVAWAADVSTTTRLWNPFSLIQWNTHKGYLRDLEQGGIPIIPTLWLPRHSSVDLRAALTERRWDQAVVKPAISASAHKTILVTDGSLAEGQAHVDALLVTKDAMVQPFVSSVRTSGERSLMVIDGALAHTILRRPKLPPGEAGKWDVLITPEDDEVALAHAVLRLVSPAPLYARVDVVRDGEGQVRLMELELVEPSLFLTQAPTSAQRFADAIISRLPLATP